MNMQYRSVVQAERAAAGTAGRWVLSFLCNLNNQSICESSGVRKRLTCFEPEHFKMGRREMGAGKRQQPRRSNTSSFWTTPLQKAQRDNSALLGTPCWDRENLIAAHDRSQVSPYDEASPSASFRTLRHTQMEPHSSSNLENVESGVHLLPQRLS